MIAGVKTEGTYTPDGLIAGSDDPMTRRITLLSGENRARGALLGKITLGAASSAAKAGGNTGNGTLTMDVTNPVRAGAKAGVYQVRLIAAATNAGTFRVTDPDGFVLGDVAVGATFDNDIKFATADGSTDFAVGDGFDITLAAGSGKYRLSLAAAVDGSQVPLCILAESTDASAADKDTPAYFGGVFDENAIIYGTGHTAGSVREMLRDLGIKLQSSVVR